MMRGISTWAVAVRKPAPEQLAGGHPLDAQDARLGSIEVSSFPLVSWSRRHRAYRLPIVRGVVALVESLRIGFKALAIAANAQLAEESGPERSAADDQPGTVDGQPGSEPREQPLSGAVWAGTVILALALAIGLFFLVPVGLTSLIKHQLGSSFLFWLVEGLVRTVIFLAYLAALSRLRDLRRVFEYHGAEHKTIACCEAGDELVPERVARYSRLHPRCGTSFLLIVMVVAIFVFAPIGLPAWYLLVLTRVLGVPVIAGISFELIRWAGRNRERRWVQAVIWPGLQLQRLTTREPDHDELEVAIAALEAVLAVERPGQAVAEDLLGVEVVA